MSQVQEGEKEMAHNHFLPFTISLVTPTGGYSIKGHMNGMPTSFLVDTGAAVTLVQEETWDRIKQHLEGDLRPWGGKELVSVDGTPLQVYGSATVEIVLESTQFLLSNIIVVSPLTTSVILGVDFLRRHRVRVDLGKGQLQFEVPELLTLSLKENGSGKESIGLVRLTEVVELPPFSESCNGGYFRIHSRG